MSGKKRKNPPVTPVDPSCFVPSPIASSNTFALDDEDQDAHFENFCRAPAPPTPPLKYKSLLPSHKSLREFRQLLREPKPRPQEPKPPQGLKPTAVTGSAEQSSSSYLILS